MDEIKNFRQFGAKTPGHPEYGCAPGVETTTGPLGQGFANGVGMALAERIENARFGDSLVDHRVFVVAGDGCLSEGIVQEAASLAGHLALSKLIVLFDDNGITIDGETSLSSSDDHLTRFAACGWHTAAADGHSPPDIRRAISRALRSQKPSIIACKTVIGFGAPTKAGTANAHGAPLGEDEVAAARKQLNWRHPPFVIPDNLRAKWREIAERGADEYAKWQKRLAATPADTREEWTRWRERKCAAQADAAIDSIKKEFAENPPTIATRKASEKTLAVLADKIPGMVGGSADLTGSNNTKTSAQRAISAKEFGGGYVHYGVREHAMAAAMNGMALHGLLPYGGTFLVFSDYCRPAIRLSALLGGAGDLCFDARFYRTRRRRTDSSAGGTSGGVARDSESLRLSSRRCNRNGGMLARGNCRFGASVRSGVVAAKYCAGAPRLSPRKSLYARRVFVAPRRRARFDDYRDRCGSFIGDANRRIVGAKKSARRGGVNAVPRKI